MQAYMNIGTANVTRVNGMSSPFGARLETVSNGVDTIPGLMLIGTPGNGTINGGLFYTTKPDSMIGYVKYNEQFQDTASIILFFKNSGVMIGAAFAKFHDSQANYVRFSVPCFWFYPTTPDTLAVLISSSNLDGIKKPGSFFTIDSLSVKEGAFTTPIFNGEMELWSDVSSEDPDNWTTTNIGSVFSGNLAVTKSLNAKDSLYAVSIKNVPTVWNDTLGYLLKGVIGNNGPDGGMPVSLNPSKVTGWYQYFPVGLDTAMAGLLSSRFDGINSINLDSNIIPLPPVGIYTYFEIPLTYNSWPTTDTLAILFTSGNIMNQNSYVGLGSELLIDKLDIVYNPVGMTGNNFGNEDFVVFPNPTDNNAFVQFNSPSKSNYTLTIFDCFGQLVSTKTYPPNATSDIYKIDVSSYTSGIYLFNLQTEKGIISRKVVVY